MKKFLPYLILIAVVAVIAYLWQVKPQPLNNQANNTEDNSLTVNFVFAPGQTTSVEYELLPDSQTSVFKITKDIAEQKNWAFDFQDYGEMGLLVNKIDSKTGGDNNSYWLYYINDEQPQVSVDKYFPQGEDILEWRFEPSTY